MEVFGVLLQYLFVLEQVYDEKSKQVYDVSRLTTITFNFVVVKLL